MPTIAASRRCAACGEVKPADAFHRRASDPSGLHSRCKVCRFNPPVHPPDTKFCRACWVRKPLSEFVVQRKYKTGRGSKCRVCNRAYQLAWVASRGEEERERRRLASRRYGNHRSAVWAKANPDKIRETNWAWRQRNRDQMRERARCHYLANKETIYQRSRAYRREHPEMARLASARYRARRLANGGTFTEAEWLAMCEAQHWLCLACGELKPLTIDHIVPLALGGEHTAANIQGLCQPCNSRKRDRIIDYRLGVAP